MKDARLELRIHKRLLERIDAARGDVSRTRWVERALESALREPGYSEAKAAIDMVSDFGKLREMDQELGSIKVPPERWKKPPGVMSARELAMERQRKLNEGKS
jgi:hypothetical protein